MKSEDLMTQSRNFFNFYKKEIGKSIRSGKHIIYIDFDDLSSFSHTLSEQLISSPEEVLQILELALEESGLVANPRVLIKNIPSEKKKEVSQLTILQLQKLIEVSGVIIKRDKVRHKITNVRYECPACGTTISVLQVADKITHPKRCKCGRKDGFKILSRGIESVLGVTIKDTKTDDTIYFEEIFNEDNDKLLREGNIISVVGILVPKDIPNSREIYFEIEPRGIQLIKIFNENVGDVESFIENLRKKENEGAYLFEELIGKLFEKKGYKVRVTKKSGDYGIDVIADKGTEKIAIQCRLLDSSDKIGNSAIQKALGGLVSPYNATKLIFITTAGGYTSQATEQTKSCKVPVELWDREKVIAEIKAQMYDLEEGWNLLNEYEEKKRKHEESLLIKQETFDIDRISIGISKSHGGRVILVREALLKLENRIGKLIPLEEIYRELQDKLNIEEIKETIKLLKHSGDIFEPRKDYIQRV